MTTFLLSLGHRLTASPAEAMQPCSPEQLLHLLRDDEGLRVETQRLRKIRQLDAAAYSSLKTRLPYVVGAAFEGGVRHSDHFREAQVAWLDLDGVALSEAGTVPDAIVRHPATLLAFVSPGGKGVKVLLRLAEPCRSLAEFKAFYRPLACWFGEAVQLSGSIDLRTCDATRACFLCHDPQTFYNPAAEAVDWRPFLPAPDPEAPQPAPATKMFRQEAYTDLLRAINPHTTAKPQKQAFVPDTLVQAQTDIRQLCLALNLDVVGLQPISYGLKIQVRQGYRAAEVNLFYGKKGFTVVRSPKSGTDAALAEVLFRAVDQFFNPPALAGGVPLTGLVHVN